MRSISKMLSDELAGDAVRSVPIPCKGGKQMRSISKMLSELKRKGVDTWQRKTSIFSCR